MYEIEVKNIKVDELDEVIRVEKEAWPPEIQAPKEKFESRISIFPEGFFGLYVDGRLVGVSTSELIRYSPDDRFTWEEITDNGWIRRTHTPTGNAVYVVSVGVSQAQELQLVREYLRQNGESGLGTRLVEAQKLLARRLNKGYLVLGARIPDYHKYRDMSVEKYLATTIERNGTKEPLDPEIRFYSRCGLEVVKAIPNYMEDDPQSLNWGAVMHWKVK